MKYHDNIVYIPIDQNSGYTLKSGSYTVKSFAVSHGQDPHGEIHVGLTKPFGSDGKLSFRVGRHGSSEVANWFASNAPASHTTFNQHPDKLNFAFIGTLRLTITGGIFGQQENTFTFENIAIAQGHSGSSNNWWFGGSGCQYIGANTVSCTGFCDQSLKLSCHFSRGGNAVNVINTVPDGVSSWLGNLNDSLRLDQITMPGSHDAGMSSLHHCNPALLADAYTRTQSLSIGAQMACGARYFDIRVDYDHDNLVTYHRNGGFGCNGQSLKDVLDETVSFLNTHRTEIVILKFSHIRNHGNDHKPAETKAKINGFLNSYNQAMYTNNNANINLAKVPLGEARGKMILVFDYPEYIHPATGRFRYQDSSTAQSNVAVFDQYSNTATYNDMKVDQLNKWAQHAKPGQGVFFLLSWTLTSNKPPSTGSIKSLAKQANAGLPEVLQEQVRRQGWQRPNIVYIDFVNRITNQAIVSLNFQGNLPLK
ncbi:hypothetical protein [uncultured Microscilla sp.]|uniref:hypothetical protein n=1 Tax=uncultured Microscilla sp. TaxID=432653 RepID=UPI00260D7A47|nr:hypothetical protein [uncultured Microscilla sp.]